MINLENISACKTIAIWGLGKDGSETLREVCLRAPNTKILTFDESNGPVPAEFASTHCSFEDAFDKLKSGKVDLLIRSPGISVYRKDIVDLRLRGVKVITSLDLWLSSFREKTCPIIVTGTKGKSTTSSLINHIFTEVGVGSNLIGNIGIPMLNCTVPKEVTVIEASSYQLSDLNQGPEVALILNLFQEHIDWHLTKENYFSDKLRLLDLLSINTRIACYSNEELRIRLKHRSDIIWYDKPEEGFWVKNNSIMFFLEEILNEQQIKLRGKHNLSNVCAALTVAYKKTSIPPQTLANTISTFSALDHRLQLVGTWKGITFINDSISTTTDSALAGVKSQGDSPIILILGGQDRGLEFGEFIDSLNDENVKHIIFTGESGRRIFNEITSKKFNFGFCYEESFESAVKRAIDFAKDGDTILLSPASPSYGEFKNFEKRGECFSNIASNFGNGE